MERYRYRYERFIEDVFEAAHGLRDALARWLRDRLTDGKGIGDPDSFVDEVFGELGQFSGVSIRTLRSPQAPINRRLALLSTDADDVMVTPGVVVVEGDDGRMRARLLQLGFVPDEAPETDEIEFSGEWLTVGDVAAEHVDQTTAAADLASADEIPVRDVDVYFWEGGTQATDLDRTRKVLDTVAEFESTDRAGGGIIAPAYGFISAQRIKPGTDYELPKGDVVSQPIESAPNGRIIHVLDTGLTSDPPKWVTSRLVAASISPSEREPSTPAGTHLSWGAGHGTFVGSVAHQVSPATTIVVHKVADRHGLVNELTVSARLDRIAKLPGPDPIVVMSFGGYEYGATENQCVALPLAARRHKMPLLQAAIQRFLKAKPGAVVVAAAGNESTNIRCYPAAFAGFAWDAVQTGGLEPWWQRVVSVGAIDSCGKPAHFSNSGYWVRSVALGVGLSSQFVTGDENPAHELDDDAAEKFVGFALGDGTSFAAPIVAAAITDESLTIPISSPAQAWAAMCQGPEAAAAARSAEIAALGRPVEEASRAAARWHVEVSRRP